MTSRCLKRCRRKLLALAVASCFAAELAHGNPTGPTVVRGQASFAAQGNTLTVTNSPGAVINWQSFSIPSQEITRFLQQSAASAVLNRVTGSTPSSILGQLQSNGRVYLINPNGITIGQGAVIDVAGFVASSLNLSDADFAAGRLRFTETPGAGAVINRGEIKTSSGGMVYLVGQSVENHGVIKTPEGEIVLAAGKSIELVDAGTPEIRVQITAPDNQALNLGQLLASGGRIGMYAGLVRHGGTANANTAVVGENGKIVFKATKSVTLEAGSVTTASGPTAGSIEIEAETGTAVVAGLVEANATAGHGGSVDVSGRQGVVVEATGRISANGSEGGAVALSSSAGPIRVAGQVSADASAGRGGRVSVAAATQTTLAAGARITASGTHAGGSVSVTANDGVTLEAGSTIQANGASGGIVTIDAALGPVEINGSLEATGDDAAGGTITVAALSDITLGDTSVLLVGGRAGGETRIEAREGTTLASGTIDASGTNGPGGKVLLLAPRVALIRNAYVNVSGRTGGGVALVGGDLQGSNPEVPNALRTYVGADARIAADAIETGDGGKVVVWSDEVTRYYGTISARGGVNGGNGGFAEVSGKEFLVYRGTADLRAPAGSFGTLLLDPRDITIQASGADDNQLNAAVPAGPDPAGSIYFADVNGTTDFTLTAATVSASTSNIVLQAQRDVNVNAAVNITTSGVRFTAQAGRDVKISAALTTNAGQIILEADSPHQPGGMDGVGMVIVNAPVNSCGGAVPALCSGANITLIGGGNSSPQGGFTLNADVNAGTGGINVALSTNSVGLDFFIGAGGNTQLSSNDTGSLKTTGALVLGTAMSAGTNGLGTGAVSLTVQSITNATASPVQLSTESGSSFQLVAGSGGITLSKPLTSFQDMVIATTGPLVISQTISTSNNDLSITASSVTLTGSGSINTGTGTVTCSGGGCGALGTSIVWDGGANTLNWFDAANWSGDAVPDGTKDVTINVTTPISSSTTVLISTGGAAVAKSLNALTPVELSSGSLTLANASTFNNSLTLSGGSLTATNFVTVGSPTGALTWSGGSIGGAGGSFILASSQSGTLSNALSLNLPFQNSGTLTLSGATISGTGSINNLGTLTATGTNSVAKMLLSSGSIGGAGALTVDDWSRTGGLFNMTGTASLRVPSGNFAVDQTYSAGNLTLLAPAGDIVLNAAVTGTGASGTTVTLAAGSAFTNNVGAAAIDPGTGRWLVYSTNPSGNTFGGLVSGNKAIWGRSYPTAVAESGNRYVFSDAGSVTVTTTDASKTYGQTADVSSNYTLSGTPVTGAATYGNVFANVGVAEIFSAGPAVSSAGSVPTASVAAGPYSITATGTANSGYSLTFTNSGFLTVNKADFTSLTGTKTYDGSASFTSGQLVLTGVNSETFTLASATANSANASLNSGATTFVSTGAVTGGGNYNTLSLAGLTTNTATINRADYTSLTGTKTYDGSASFTSGQLVLTGVNSETFTLASATANSANASLNSGATTFVSTGAVTGGGNYNTLSLAGLTTNTATINRADYTSLTGTKTYDGSASFTSGQLVLTGVNSETFTLASATANSANASLNSGATTFVSTGAVTGGGNYNTLSLAGLTTNTATINRADYTSLTGTKTYDGSASFTSGQLVLTGVNSETFTLASATANSANASLNSGATTFVSTGAVTGGGNYNTLSLAGLTTNTATINRADYTSLTGTKTYDGSASFTSGQLVLTGVNSETFTLASATANSANASLNSGATTFVSTGAVTGGGNYNTLSLAGLTTNTATINRADYTSLTGTKTYDGSASFTSGQLVLTGVNSETFTLASATANSANASLNSGATTFVSTGAVTGGGNYNTLSLAGLTTNTATINRADYTSLTGTKTYDGSASFTSGQLVLTGVNSETFTLASATANSANASLNSGATTFVSTGAVTGGGNYNTLSLAGLTTNTATINRADYTSLTGTKTYDGSASFTSGQLVLTGVNSETFTLASATANSANASLNSGATTFVSTGAVTGGGNYNTLSLAGLTTNTATINRADYTSLTGTKTYDGSASFTSGQLVLTGVNSETFTLASATANSANASLNSGATTFVSTGAVTGGGNYNTLSLAGLTTNTATINRADYTSLTGTKTYDGSASFTSGQLVLTGVNSETFTLASATANSANASLNSGATTFVSTGAVTGGGNYNTLSLAGLTTNTATINRADYTSLTGTKTYDGSASFTSGQLVLTGVNSETFTLASATANSANASLNSGATTFVSTGAVTGGGNYNTLSLAGLTTNTATINRADYTSLTGTKTYDGSASFTSGQLVLTGVNSETFTLASATANSANASLNSGATTFVSTGAVTGGGNYNTLSLAGLTTNTATINRADYTSLTGTKTYDGSASFTSGQLVLTGVNSETFTLASATANSANASLNSGATTFVSTGAVTGGGNYNTLSLAGLTTNTATINRADYTSLTGTKTYDGSASFTSGQLVLTGVNSETFTLASATANSANASLNSGATTFVSTGAVTGGGNYNTLSLAGLTTNTATINRADYTSLTGTKTYDGSASFTSGQLVLTGVNSETFTLASATANSANASLNSGATTFVSTGAVTGGGNYNTLSLAGLTTNTATINRADYTSLTGTKTYDGSASFTSGQLVLTGVNSETFTLASATANSANASLNSGATTFVSTGAVTGGGNYNTLSLAGLTTNTATINRADYTSLTGTKTYDGSASFTSGQLVLTGVNSETFTLASATANSANASLNSGATTFVSTGAVTGGGNYNTLSLAGLTTNTATINRADYTSLTGTKTYDGSASFTSGQLVLTGVNSETFTLASATANSANASLNSGATTFVSTGAVTGGGNYNTLSLAGLTTNTATINRADYTSLTGTKTYDGSASFTSGQLVLTGVNSETFTLASATANSANASLNSGATTFVSTGAVTGGGNYNTLSLAGLTTNTATINRADYTSLTGTKTYDGSASFTSGQLVLTGVNSETFTLASATANSANASLNSGATTFVSTGAVTGGGNYNTLSLAGLTTNTATINRALLNLTLSRAYDGSTNFGAGLIGTLIGVNGETLGGGGGTGTVASPNVAAGIQTLSLGGLALGNGTGLAGNYTLVGGTHTATITAANLTGTIANQTKIYGADDPALAGIGVTLGGVIGSDASNLAATLSTLMRTGGENVASYGITSGTFNALTGSAAGNYNAPTFTGSPILVITPAPALTAGINNQVKTYGINDPALSTIGVTLGGLVNRTVSTWNGTVALNDTGNVAAALATLARTGGENVGSYGITNGSLNALTGSAAGNYSGASLNVAGSTLTINPVPLTAGIADQTKTYASNDPAVGTIAVTLGGAVNASVTDWNGNVTVINDTVALAPTLTDLTRVPGENVGSYNITGGTLTLNGAAAANYSGASLNVSGITLDIVAPLPTAVVSPTVTTWDGPVAVDINFIWTAGASGSWTTGSAWDKGFAPVNGAVVTIPDIGAPGVTNAITYSGGTINLRSLTSSEALTVAGGALNLGTTPTDVSTIPLVTLSGGVLGGAGTVNVATMNILAGGILNGTGTIIGNVNNTAGTVAPGVSPGILTINGNYVQGPGGTLAVEIGGTAAGTQYDQLVITGNATLDGTLNVALINGFVPASGNSFTVVQGGTVSGAFATTNFPAAQPMTTTYLASNVSVLANASPPLAQLPPSAPAPPLIDQLPGLPESGSGTGLNIVTVVNPDTGQREILDGFVGQNIVTTVNPETGERQILDGVVGQNVVTTVNPLTGEREFVGVTAGDSKSGGKIGVCK